ncbi:MAG: arsenosugar biosynthesis radical SAM (seleno)protein ArsS [Burkholderiales bacterium]
MHATLPLLKITDFPPIKRRKLDCVQVNLGYKCNQACLHCHVNASPDRKEMMQTGTIDTLIDFLRSSGVTTLDLTGGAPELNQHFRRLVIAARELKLRVIDRCNLTILFEPGQETLAQFLADNKVEITASLPCYTEALVDKQRGDGVYEKSIRALQQLNLLGYGKPGSGLKLNLVYNPQGASLPPAQTQLQADYQRELKARHHIDFNELFVIANMPIQRFGSTLVSQGKFAGYMDLLRAAHQQSNLENVMCRTLISVDYLGYVYDCDFNQMLGIPLKLEGKPRRHLSDLMAADLDGSPIMIADHCYGCTAGQGSSCGGSLAEAKAA